jgi:hypothetical protein
MYQTHEGGVMTHKSIERLLVVVGLALFLLVGVVLLPLRAARAAPAAHAGIGRLEAVVFTTALSTDTPVPDDSLVPTWTSTPTVVLTPTQAPTPTETPAPTPTPAPTDTPSPTATPAPTEEPPPTDTATATVAPTVAPTAAPTEAPTPTPVPPPTALPTPTPTPLEWLPLPAELKGFLVTRWPLVTGGCLVLILVVLVVLLLLVTLRRKKPTPKPPPRPYPDAAPVAYLENVGAAGGSRRFSLKPGGVSIGRAPDNDVVITQDLAGWDTVSRQHARVYQREGQWVVDDLDSVNGVWVNGRRTGHNLLRSGWQLRIGGVEFVFHVGTGEAS